MGRLDFLYKCDECFGAKVKTYNSTPNGPLVTGTCPKCGGTGEQTTLTSIDSDMFEQILTKVDFVYNKTDNIINKLNDIKDKCDQIWDKVK